MVLRFLIVCFVFLFTASVAAQTNREPDAQSPRDRYPEEQWLHYADVSEAGFSAQALARAKTFWQNRDSSAFLAVSGGAVVAAWGDIDRRFFCHSIRKSFLSALYGVHFDEIDLQATVADLGLDDQPPLTSAEKQARVVDLIRSRSGVYHEAAAEPPEMSRNRPERSSREPGSHWWYNNWDFNAAGVIFEQSTGRGIFEAFDRSIAEPIGMQDYRPSDGFYHHETNKSQHPAYMFRMSTRDLARFGLLYAREGRWKDRQVIPQSWVEESTRSHSEVEMGAKYGSGYGYMWWIEDDGGFTARGSGGHILAVYPNRDLVMVVRADTFRDQSLPTRAAMRLFQKVLEAGNRPRAESPRLIPAPPGSTELSDFEPAPERLASYETEIVMSSGRRVTVAASDSGLTLDYGFGVFGLEPQSPTSFIAEDSREQVLFELDSEGRVSRVWAEPLIYSEAASAVQQGDIDSAVRWVREAVDRFPTSSRAHLNLARALYGAGNPSEARIHAKRAVELDPENQLASRLHQRLQLLRFRWFLGALALALLLGITRVLIQRRRASGGSH